MILQSSVFPVYIFIFCLYNFVAFVRFNFFFVVWFLFLSQTGSIEVVGLILFAKFSLICYKTTTKLNEWLLVHNTTYVVFVVPIDVLFKLDDFSCFPLSSFPCFPP
jgi:hypothetical protein